MTRIAPALASVAAKLRGYVIGEAARDVEEFARPRRLEVRDRRLEEVPGAVEFVAVAQVRPGIPGFQLSFKASRRPVSRSCFSSIGRVAFRFVSILGAKKVSSNLTSLSFRLLSRRFTSPDILPLLLVS